MDLLTQFKNELLRQEKSENTISSYIKRIEDFLIWLSDRYDETDPTAITEIDVREYKSFCMNVKKYAPSGINQRLAAIKSYCDFLVGQDKLEYNPARKIKQVKIVKGKTAPDVLERNDYNKFKREFYKDNNKRNIAIFEVLSNTGIRVSELVNIEINDMDISERKGVLVVRGKGNKYSMLIGSDNIFMFNDSLYFVRNYRRNPPRFRGYSPIYGRLNCSCHPVKPPGKYHVFFGKKYPMWSVVLSRKL